METDKNEKRIRVAIVEDDAGLRESMGKMLALASDCLCVGAFASAETALVKLPPLAPKVILMDINLPKMDGVECVRRLAELTPLSHILMVTVFKDTESIFRALEAGAVGYLLKPVRSAQLLEAVREAAAGGAPMTGSIARKVVEAFRQGPPATSDMDRLTTRETEVLELLGQGFLYKEIANRLGVSIGTVNTLVHRIYERLHVHSRKQAIARYKQSGG